MLYFAQSLLPVEIYTHTCFNGTSALLVSIFIPERVNCMWSFLLFWNEQDNCKPILCSVSYHNSKVLILIAITQTSLNKEKSGVRYFLKRKGFRIYYYFCRSGCILYTTFLLYTNLLIPKNEWSLNLLLKLKKAMVRLLAELEGGQKMLKALRAACSITYPGHCLLSMLCKCVVGIRYLFWLPQLLVKFDKRNLKCSKS